MKLFVYGTLQPGEPLAPWLREAWVGEPERATTPGTIYHVPGGSNQNPLYPVALIGTWEDAFGPQVSGTVLDVDPDHPAVDRTIHMEQSAGYELVAVLCTLEGGVVISALGFRYEHTPGSRIEHGDWRQVVHTIEGPGRAEVGSAPGCASQAQEQAPRRVEEPSEADLEAVRVQALAEARTRLAALIDGCLARLKRAT